MGSASFTGALYRAMKDGQDARVAELVAGRESRLAEAGEDGCIASPLISAVFSERLDYLHLLLEAGADPNRRDMGRKGSSYNLRALEAALWFDRDDMAAALVAAGTTEDFGTSVFRADVEAVRRGIEEDGALLGARFIRHDQGLLFTAAYLGCAPLVELFLDLGLDPNATDGDGHGPLRFAARNEPSLDVMAALVDGGADVNNRSRSGITALTAACRHEQSVPSVRWLLEHGADPNLVPANGTSALMKAVSNKVPEMVELLLAHGADRNHDSKGRTALDIAKRKRDTTIVALLS